MGKPGEGSTIGWRGVHAERQNALTRSRVQSWSAAAQQTRASEASAAAVLPNLESSPRLSRVPCYSVTVMDFGDGIVEARAVFCDPRPRLRSAKLESVEVVGDALPVTVVIDEQREKEKQDWRRRRAARSLRYRCLALKADHMITFTKRGKFQSLEDLRDAWRRFFKLVRKFPNLDFRYVAVPELHGDGETWHLHVAVRGRYDVVFLRRLWYRALGGRGDERGEETPGSINARYFQNRRKAATTVASYMSKYMGKSFVGTGGGRKSYWCSQGLVPVVTRFQEPYGDCSMMNIRDVVAPMAPKNTLWRLFEWEYVGLHGFIFKTH